MRGFLAALRMTSGKQTTAKSRSPSGMTNKKSNGNNKGEERFYIPTHRDETAMNGAPDLFGLVGEITAR
jgi:hypothetical protein